MILQPETFKSVHQLAKIFYDKFIEYRKTRELFPIVFPGQNAQDRIFVDMKVALFL